MEITHKHMGKQPTQAELAAENQALLEAPTLEARAETLIAMTEYEMARGGSDGTAPLN